MLYHVTSYPTLPTRGSNRSHVSPSGACNPLSSIPLLQFPEKLPDPLEPLPLSLSISLSIASHMMMMIPRTTTTLLTKRLNSQSLSLLIFLSRPAAILVVGLRTMMVS